MDNNNREGLPAITLDRRNGQVTLHQTTLNAIGRPEYFRMLLDDDNSVLLLESCSHTDQGGIKIYYSNANNNDSDKRYERVYSRYMLRLLYTECGWLDDYSYRIYGTKVQGKPMVCFLIDRAEIVGKKYIQGNYTEVYEIETAEMDQLEYKNE